jgi:hypothetical protein
MDNTALIEKIRKTYIGKDEINGIADWFFLGVRQDDRALTKCCLEIIKDWKRKNYEDDFFVSADFAEAAKFTEFFDVLDDLKKGDEDSLSSFRYSFNPFILGLDEIASLIKFSPVTTILKGARCFVGDIIDQEKDENGLLRSDNLKNLLVEYVNSWISTLIDFLEKHKKELMSAEDGLTLLARLLRYLIDEKATQNAFDYLFAFMKDCVDEFGLSCENEIYTLIDTAVYEDNEYAFSALMDEVDRKGLKIRITRYPCKSLSILSRIFSTGQLLPGTDEARPFFYSLVGKLNPQPEIIKMTYHPSYSMALSRAAQNKDFSPELYPLLMNLGDDVNEIRYENLSPLGYYAISNGNKKGVEKLLELGGDLLKSDKDGNTVLHYVCSEHYANLGNIVNALPSAFYLFFENNEGKTPLDLLLDKEVM